MTIADDDDMIGSDSDVYVICNHATMGTDPAKGCRYCAYRMRDKPYPLHYGRTWQVTV